MKSPLEAGHQAVGFIKRLGSCEWRGYALVVFSLVCIFALLRQLPATRVGDGAEYYGLYLAFEETMRPWLTTPAFLEYENLVREGRIGGLVSSELLQNAFPALRIGATADFNHFWLYSFLAYSIAKLLGLVGLQLSPHSAFIALHWFLFSVTVCVGLRFYGWKGVAVVVGLTAGSPMLWFVNKVHTEFFTYCLGLASVIFVLRAKYIPAALCMAVASTQNPSFGLLAALLLLIRASVQSREQYAFLDVLGIVWTVLLAFIHPVYYFFRYGVPTPQLLAGGAEVGANLRNSYIWILDPDVGLFPNWPLGLLTCGVALVATSAMRRAGRFQFNFVVAVFYVAYLGASLFAQSSTTNLNSGATIGVARYALWYVPLFFPLAIVVFDWVKSERWMAVASVVSFGGLFLLNVIDSFPSRVEQYSNPSRFSYFLQRHFSSIYDSPSEIYLERYSGLGEAGVYKAGLQGVVGPDCRKVLVLPGRDRSHVSAPAQCGFDLGKLAEQFRLIQSAVPTVRYVLLDDEFVSRVKFTPAMNHSYFLKAGGDGSGVLGGGWFPHEDWGVWSSGSNAEVFFPCETSSESGLRRVIYITVVGFTHGMRSATDVEIVAEKSALWSGKLDNVAREIKLLVPETECANGLARVRLLVRNPESPMEAGLSADPRELGVGFVRFRYASES